LTRLKQDDLLTSRTQEPKRGGNMLNRRQILAASAISSWPLASAAQGHRIETLRILTGFPPGGTVDVVARSEWPTGYAAPSPR